MPCFYKPSFLCINKFSFLGPELDALEADMGMETESDGVPSYLQPDNLTDLDSELNLPSAPTGHSAVPAGRSHAQVKSIEKKLLAYLLFCPFAQNYKIGNLGSHEKVQLIMGGYLVCVPNELFLVVALEILAKLDCNNF